MTFKVQTLSFTTNSYLKINKGDITQWFVDRSSDAIVSPTNELFSGGATAITIHEAAGPNLQKACYEVPEVKPRVRCPAGEARITPNCLRVAKANNIQYIAFPAISCGMSCYPPEEASTIAISTVKEFAQDLNRCILFCSQMTSIIYGYKKGRNCFKHSVSYSYKGWLWGFPHCR